MNCQKTFAPGGLGEALVQGYELEGGGTAFRSQESSGELERIRSAERVHPQKPASRFAPFLSGRDFLPGMLKPS